MALSSVLIIDDDEDDRFISRSLIQRNSDIDIILDAPSGIKAIELLSTLKKASQGSFMPELIILDINMPVMNGFDFIEEFKKLNDGDESAAFVAMITASYSLDDIKRIKESEHINGWFRKPLDIRTVLDLMKKENIDKYK